ncbi:MAG TPA: hypothetical protein VLD55_06610 [Candidatus Sulfobium mesophilum]|nr:hypothetical protein [Candidatus Sulfobium mesophilum]
MKNGGDLLTSDHWNHNLGLNISDFSSRKTGYSDDLFETNYSQLKLMPDPWIGETGMKVIDEAAVKRYESYLRKIDHLGLLAEDILRYGQSNGWREADLGSILDINLIA